MQLKTFKEVFGDGGNLADIDLHWACDECGEELEFRLIVEAGYLLVEWRAECCGDVYLIQPGIAAYNKKRIA